jgi:hypothetical protein
MLAEYNIYLNGYGHYKVNASIYRLPDSDENLECEVELVQVKKFDDMLEEYSNCEPTEEELTLLEREVAIKFFNNLH